MPAFRAASTIRCLSAGMATGLRRVYGDRIADKAVVVPTRVDLGVFSRPKDDWSTGAGLKLITVGACSPTKNHLALIRALAAWGRLFHLTIVGTGPLRDHYLSLGRQLGCAEALRLIGPIPHDALAAELVKHDVYVHYSLAEGLPRAVLEAMACALPVVCTRVGFLSDLAGEGGDEAPAILLDPPWAEGLHRALTLLADSPHQRRDRGLALRRQVEADFDADQVFERYRALIRAGRSCTA
jgi:glycosyltransferase involved in cell wall biosynthesis